ncbi:serine/arginine repetitive matrix protein 2-like [Scylla paramamosain]|uniref:serine/arginine repetitive matrix protein 2-like n=1 Tax=Scylla paramamosain TaxID=85552 RepID=UPI003083020A
MQEYGGEEGHVRWKAEANSPLVNQVGDSMEDPVSPATPGAESLWNADSDASSELSDIYGDIDDHAARNLEAEDVDDADIFQELGRIADEEKQLSSYRASFEAQGNSGLIFDVYSQNQRKENCQTEQTTSELTDGKMTPTCDSNVLGHNLSQTEKDYARKEEKSEALIGNSTFVCESRESEFLQDGSSVSTCSKAKKKQTRDGTKKSVESHSKKKSKSHEHKDSGSKKENKTGSWNGSPTALQLGASPNKDLQFVLSRVMNSKCPLRSRETDSSAKKNGDVSKNQHSLPKEISSERCDHSKSSSREETLSSKGNCKSATSESKMGGKEKVLEVQEGKPSDERSVMRVATEAKELHTAPGPAPVSIASVSVVDKIMMMAGGPNRSSAADFMNVGDASTTEKKTNSYTIPKKIKKESQDNQLDLFEDFLVGQDRDELLQELKKLKAEQEQLQESLRSSQQRCLGLEKDNETLLNNMSSLWKTSVSQLRQKTNELTTLKREKEAIIFRRAMRQVPKDELDRVVSHIAAYDKEELKDFINSLKEEKEEKKECMCSRGTTTPGRSESVGQRVRQATRGVRLSPSSDSEAQTLKNLLGKKGETVTHSEEKLRTWSKTRASFRSQKCLFPREEERKEDVKLKTEMTKSVWSRLGRNDLDRRKTDVENERNRISAKEEEHANRSRDASNLGDHSRNKKSSSDKEKDSRKSVFSRLGIKRTTTNEEENASPSIDKHSQDDGSDVKRGLSKDGVPDAKTPQGKMEKMHHVKKAVELSDKCMEKVRPFKEPQDESLKDRTPSGIQVSSISESADAPHSTTMKHESLGAHLSKDPAPAQENGDETGVPSGFEDEMLSKTLFGQRMKNRLKNLSKPHLTIEQEQTLSSPSSPNVHTSIPKPHVETTPTHRQIRPQDKSKATITSPLENVRKVIPAESKAQSEDKVTIRSDEGEIKQDLYGNDKQGDGLSLEKNSKRLRKKLLSICKESSELGNKNFLKGNVEVSKEPSEKRTQEVYETTSDKEKEKELTETTRGNCQEIQEDNVEQVEKNYSERQVRSADNEDMMKNEKMLGDQMKTSEWNDIDSKEMDGAILCLAKLRSVFISEGKNINKQQEKDKHLLSLFGDENLSEDDGELISKEESKENQGSEIHRTSESQETPNNQCTNRKLECKMLLPQVKNRDSAKKVTEVHTEVENVQKLKKDSVQAGDCENKLQQGLNSNQEGDTEDTDTVTAKEYPKRKESNRTAYQAQKSKDGSEKVNHKSVLKERKRKSLKNASEVDVQNESKSRDKSQTTLRSGEDHSSMFEVKHRKHHTKDRTKKIRSDAKKHKDSDIQNVEEQAKEKTNSEKKNESKKTSLDMKQKSGKSEHKTNTKETEDTVPVTQNTDERNGVTTSKRKSKKKHASDESNDKEKSSDTTKGGSLQQKKNDGKILTRTPTPVLDEEMSSDDEDEEDAEVDVELNKSPVQSPRMENILLEHEALDGIKQQDQSDGKQMRDAEGKKKNVKNNPEKNPDEDLEGERTNVIKDKKIGEEDYSNITHDRNDECQDNVRKEREVTSQDTMSSIDDQDNDILQSLLGTNYNEDSLFLSEEELLYEDGCEKEDEEEEERNSVHDQKIKYGSDSKNDHKESIVEEEQKLKKQTESKELNEKTDRVCDLDTKVSITESISSPRRSGRERGRDTPKGKPHGSYGGRDDTDTTKKSVDKQSRGDALTPKTGEKENCSRSPSHSPSPQKGNLSKPLGSRIKKLFPSTSSRRQQGREEGVSPLMAREERLQSKRTEKQEPLSKRAEKQEPQSKRGERQEQQSKRVEKQESHKRLEKQEPQNRRSERQESRHSRDETGNLRPKDKDRRKDAEEHNRKRESHSPHVLSSQNRKSPPRLRKGRKRERSESEVSGKKDWSPRKKGERSSPRKRESREDKEEPASKKRRVSVKSRLTLPPNSDEENMTRPARWQPSTPETQRTRRISSRLRNQSHVADEHMREPGWQGGTQYASKTPETQKKSSPSSVPVDSKLLRSILTQSSSKCMEQEDEKEEGELDEDEEEGKEEDGCVDEPMKNHNKDNETCDTVSKKMNDIGRQPLKPKEHNSNMEDKGKTLQIKEHKASKHNACVDSRDTQDGKSCETDKQNIPVAADKEHYEQKNADSKIVIPDRTLDSEISPERVQYTACGIEGQNNPRSSKKRGEPEKQQYSQSKASSPRMTSLVQDAVQHQDMKTRRNRRKTLEYLSEDRKEDEDHNRENCTPVDDNATFYPGDLFQLMQPKAKGHLPPDLSMSSISSVSDDTIDLMVKQHNENFPFDITNGSDDSETSLLKYIAGSEEDRCDDNEVYEQKERTKGNNCVPNSDNDSCDEDEVNDEKVKGTLPENLHNLGTKEIVLNSNTGISKRKTRLMHENEQVSPHDNDLSGEEYTKDTEFAMQIHKEVTTKGMEKITQQCYKDTSESRSPVRCGSESALSYSSTSSESKSPFKCGSENVSPSSSASSESKSPVRCGSQNVSSSSSASGESKSPVRCESQNMSSSSNTSDSRADTERQDIPIHSAVCTTHPSNTEEEDIRGTTVCQTNITEADMDEQDQQSSSDDEDDSELDVENTDGETDEHTRKLAENNCRTTSDGQYFTRREHEDNAVVEDLPSETRPITESEKANNEANSSDDSDSDSDCECSECNSSSSSSSSSSSGSSSSSSSSDSSSSDSEMEDAGVDGVEDLEKSMFGGEKNSVPVNHMASGVQSCDQESSKTVPASPIKLVSPTKLGCKTPKKTPRKTSSRTHMTELSESSGSMGAFKKTPKKPPCKKTPCKKTVSKDAQSRTPKAKRVHASLPASTERQPQDTVHTSSEKSGHFHSLFEPSNENGINEDHKTSQADLGNSDMQTSLRWSLQQSEDTVRTRHNTSTPQTNSDLSLNKNPEKQKASLPPDSFISKTSQLKQKASPLDGSSSSKTYFMRSKLSPVSLTSTPQTNSDLSLNKIPGKQKVSSPSDSFISKTFQLKQKISPLDASSSISKTYFMRSKVSPVSLTNTAPSMPFIETADAPDKRSSFGPSPGRTAQLSCTDSNNVISVVHNSKKNVNQVPKKTSSRTPKKVIQKEAVTTTPTVEKSTAKKRRLTPTLVVSNVRNSSGKKMRMIAPAMYEGVSPRKLFARTDKINQERNSPLLSSPGSSVGSPEPTKNSINKDIVVPVKVRRAKRQLNLGLSSSPVQHIYMGKQSLGQSNAADSGSLHGGASQAGGGMTPAQQKTGDSSGQVLRRSPRKSQQSSKLSI